MSGWSEWGWFAGGSVNGSRYRVFDRTSTYHAAQQHCLQIGGYLAHIDTIREQVFIEDFLRHVLDKLIALDGQSVHYRMVKRLVTKLLLRCHQLELTRFYRAMLAQSAVMRQ